jgi:hypothetical protein
VFVDAWALIALSDPDDSWHAQAIPISRELSRTKRPLVTTEWVLTEFLSSTARPPRRQLAVTFVQQRLLTSPRVRTIAATTQDWQAGFNLYSARRDQSWSLVDCISILVCQRLNIQEVFTGDHHFEQAGLLILLKKPA